MGGRSISGIIVIMNINNARKEIREYVDPMTSSANHFAVIVVVITALVVLLMFFTVRVYFAGIVHWIELTQAVLVCSTALMGLCGLMMIETKKANVTGLSSEDMFEKVRAINTITSLARAYVFLRWAMLLSIITIIVSGLCIIMNNPVFLIGSVAVFLALVYLFVWGLIFSDFLPS